MKQKHTLQWLSAVTGRAKGLVGLLVVVQTVLSVSSIAFAFVLRRIINMAVDGARGGFWASLALLVGILLGQIVLSATGRFLSEYTSATVENRFKHRLFSALLTGDYASVAAVHSGEWMNRLTSDTTVVAGGVTQIVPGLIGMLVRLLGAVTAILWLEPRFLYILLPGGAAMMLLTYLGLCAVLLESVDQLRIASGIQHIPHLGLAKLPVFILLRIGIGGVYLHRQIFLFPEN